MAIIEAGPKVTTQESLQEDVDSLSSTIANLKRQQREIERKHTRVINLGLKASLDLDTWIKDMGRLRTLSLSIANLQGQLADLGTKWKGSAAQ